MNLPCSPLYLWPVPIVLLAFGVGFDLWRRRRWRAVARTERGDGASAASPAPSKPPRHIGSIAGAVLAALATLDLAYFAAPPVRGRVVDLATGAPVQGALVSRRLYRVGAWRIAEGPAEREVWKARYQTKTGRDGEFELPGWVALWPSGFQGLTGMGWLVYESGHMPAYGCQGQAFEPLAAGWLACGGFNVPQDPDPWVATEWSGGRTGLELSVKVAVKKTPEDWSEAFGRAARLLDGEWIDITGYVAEAVGYAKTNEIDDQTASNFYDLAAGLGYLTETGERYKVQEGFALIQLVAGFCAQSPGSETCRRNRRGIAWELEHYRKLENDQ